MYYALKGQKHFWMVWNAFAHSGRSLVNTNVSILMRVNYLLGKYLDNSEICSIFVPEKHLRCFHRFRLEPKIFNVYFRLEDRKYVEALLKRYSRDYRKCIHYDESGCESIDEEQPSTRGSFISNLGKYLDNSEKRCIFARKEFN